MDTSKELLQVFMNHIDEGIIYVNKQKEFQHINERAKRMLGFTTGKQVPHPKGKIMPGDIVIIADSALGFDDGGLTLDDLALINVTDQDILPDYLFIAIGVYKNKDISPVYKYLPNNYAANTMDLDRTYMGFSIRVMIKPFDKILSISVNGQIYEMSFYKAAGHMVIIDSNTGEVKFYQAKGYSIRKESVREVLRGTSYRAKGNDVEEFDPIGKKIETILDGSKLMENIDAILSGDIPSISNEIMYINKFTTLCSLVPVSLEGEIHGVMLKLTDAAELEQLLEIRNTLIGNIELAYSNEKVMKDDTIDQLFKNITGISDAIQRIKYLAYRASKTHSNIVITGESGTGKSQLAYEIHKLYRKGAPFIEVNCSSIPQNLFESELFGYVGGSFTGALSSGKAGYFELANGGTIFLDEIGELPLDMQVKLLHVLQNKRFYRVGSSKPINIDVRIITATNRDLRAEVIHGTFRQDLYYRLNVFPIFIPPLRERKSDIYPLINSIIRRICAEYNLPLKQCSGMAFNKLLNYDWPGNIRELENILERAITITEGDLILPEYLDIDACENIFTLKEAVDHAERSAILSALNSANGNRLEAAKILDISKSGLYEKIRKYDINL